MNQTIHAGPGQPPAAISGDTSQANPHAPLRNVYAARVDGAVPQYVQIAALVALHPGIETEGSFRNRIQKYEAAKRTRTATEEQLDFLKCVMRPAKTRRIVIDYPRYLYWLTSGRQGEAA